MTTEMHAAVVVVLQLFLPLFDLNSGYLVLSYWSLSTARLTGLSLRKEIVPGQQREFLESSRVLTFSHQVVLTYITAYNFYNFVTTLKCRVLGIFWPDI